MLVNSNQAQKTFLWLDNNKRIYRKYEPTFDSAEEMVKIATIKLPLSKI